MPSHDQLAGLLAHPGDFLQCIIERGDHTFVARVALTSSSLKMIHGELLEVLSGWNWENPEAFTVDDAAAMVKMLEHQHTALAHGFQFPGIGGSDDSLPG